MSRRASWLLVVALAVSVGVNLYGAVSLLTPLGAAPQATVRPAAGDSLLERRVAAMAPADAAVLGNVSAAHRETLREREKAVRAARAAVGKALRAEPFAAAVLEARLAALRAALQDMQETYHRIYLEAAPRLSPDGRRRMLSRPPPAGGASAP